jgi:hypothetical protein
MKNESCVNYDYQFNTEFVFISESSIEMAKSSIFVAEFRIQQQRESGNQWQKKSDKDATACRRQR